MFEIIKIQISPVAKPLTPFWKPSKSGLFSTKSAFYTDQSNRFMQASSHNSFNWKNLWSANMHNRHKLLIWKIIHDIVPTSSRLSKIFPIDDSNCVFCNDDDDSTDHIFLKCPLISQIYFISKWCISLDRFKNESITNWIATMLDMNNNLFPSLNLKKEFIIFIAVLFDLLWMNRNLIAHRLPSLNLQDLLTKVQASSEAHWKIQQIKYITAGKLTNQKWNKPPPGWLKVNTDASFIEGKASSAQIIRNSSGSIILAHTKTHVCMDSLVAEAVAIKKACYFLDRAKIEEAIIESDCLNAIYFITNAT